MLRDLLKFIGYGLAIAVLLPPLLVIFSITAWWSFASFIALLAIW